MPIDIDMSLMYNKLKLEIPRELMKNLPKILLDLDTSEVWGRSLMRGIVKYATVHGPWMFYRKPPYYLADKSRNIVYWAKKFNVDGIIMLEPTPEEENDLLKLSLPTFVSGYNSELNPHFANILSEHREMGKMAAEHLLERGFKQFAFFGYDKFWSIQRCQGFTETIEQAGYSVDVYKQPRTKKQRSWEFEQYILADWLKSLPKPVGIMSCIDNRSLHVVEACKIAHIRIPIDVAVIGVNNDKLLCSLTPSPLSSVAISAKQGGYETAKIMDGMIKKEISMKGQFVLIQPTYVASRQSTDTLAVTDKLVIDAIYFIQNNFKNLIQVEDVVAAVNTSKRTLQRRFRDIMGYSIHEQINKAQVDYIAELLRNTNMSISQIAISMGYSGPENISRLFQKAKGMNASQYRKQFGN
jgi:LacI family transcriptional regulator